MHLSPELRFYCYSLVHQACESSLELEILNAALFSPLCAELTYVLRHISSLRFPVFLCSKALYPELELLDVLSTHLALLINYASQV